MLSRFSNRAPSLSPRHLHQQSIYPCFHSPHILPQALFWHRLSQEQASSDNTFILPLRTERASRKTQLIDAALKSFLRSFTDIRKTDHNTDASESQVLSLRQPKGKEGHLRKDELKLSQIEKQDARLENVPAKFHAWSKDVKEEGFVRRNRGMFSKRAKRSPDVTDESVNTAEDEESATETSTKGKVISVKSRTVAEVHTVRIRRNLTEKFLRHLQTKIDFLHASAVPLIQVKSLLKKRAFLSASPEKLVAVIEVLTEIFKSKSIAFDVLKANTGIIAQPLEMLKHKMHIFLQYEVDKKACIKIGTTKGTWTLCAQKLEERLNLLKEIGMHAQARTNALARFPRLLNYSTSRLRATIEFLESLGFSGPQLLKILEVHPTLFGSSVNKSLAVRVKRFQDWGFSASDVMRYLWHDPLGNVKHIESQYKLLRDQGLSHRDASSIIRRHPSVFSSSTKNLKAKLDFLGQVNRDISEILKSPSYLGFSLEQRIIPRFKALEAVTLREKPSLYAILSCDTSNFKRRFNIPESLECM